MNIDQNWDMLLMVEPNPVSVIMPAYESRLTIHEAVVSVLRQSHTALELIIVSDDRICYAPLVPADRRIVFLTTGAYGAGPSVARNIGIDAARHPLVGFLDSDDLWYPEKLQVLAPLAYQNGLAIDNVRYCYSAEKKPCGTYWTDPVDGRYDFAFFAQVSQGLWPIYRRDLIDSVRFVDNLRFAEDAVFNLSLIAKNNGAYLCGQSLHEYRIRNGSLSQSPDSAVHAERAYSWVLAQLRTGNPLHFPADKVPAAIAIFEKRRALNRAFIDSGLSDFQAFETQNRMGH